LASVSVKRVARCWSRRRDLLRFDEDGGLPMGRVGSGAGAGGDEGGLVWRGWGGCGVVVVVVV